jgi:hypothetical protein
LSRRPNTGRLYHREDFPELDASLGLDDDELSALKRRGTLERTRKPSDVSHHTVADEISLFDHVAAPLACRNYRSRDCCISETKQQSDARLRRVQEAHRLLVFPQIPRASIITG